MMISQTKGLVVCVLALMVLGLIHYLNFRKVTSGSSDMTGQLAFVKKVHPAGSSFLSGGNNYHYFRISGVSKLLYILTGTNGLPYVYDHRIDQLPPGATLTIFADNAALNQPATVADTAVINRNQYQAAVRVYGLTADNIEILGNNWGVWNAINSTSLAYVLNILGIYAAINILFYLIRGKWRR
ncbi:hypothetical protein HBIMPC_14165 [Chitinophaga sp. 212800010-3]|nr:hypothetical protein [Chitinophaga sp. 212800010-3]